MRVEREAHQLRAAGARGERPVVLLDPALIRRAPVEQLDVDAAQADPVEVDRRVDRDGDLAEERVIEVDLDQVAGSEIAGQQAEEALRCDALLDRVDPVVAEGQCLELVLMDLLKLERQAEADLVGRAAVPVAVVGSGAGAGPVPVRPGSGAGAGAGPGPRAGPRSCAGRCPCRCRFRYPSRCRSPAGTRSSRPSRVEPAVAFVRTMTTRSCGSPTRLAAQGVGEAVDCCRPRRSPPLPMIASATCRRRSLRSRLNCAVDVVPSYDA